MVLSLPILLLVMALMINFGTAACWKIRGLSVARHAVWSTRWPRSGHSDPLPDYWPQGTAVEQRDAGHVPELDDPRVDQPVARGPMMLGTTVHEELLDPTRGLRKGSASITRRFPFLAKLREYHLEANTYLLDDKWQYLRMSWPEQNYRLWHNVQRRIPVLYALARAPAQLVEAHIQAALAIMRAPFRPQLAPLDRDDEFTFFGYALGWGRGAPDFHPRLSRFCSLDLGVAGRQVEHLINRIQGKVIRGPDGRVRRIPSVAEVMAGAFIGLYRRVLQAFPNLDTSGLSPAEAANLAAAVTQLDTRINILEQFLATLRQQDGN